MKNLVERARVREEVRALYVMKRILERFVSPKQDMAFENQHSS